MDQVLDLRIILTPPPQDASADVLALINLLGDQPGLSRTGDFLVISFTKEERALLQWYLEEYWQWPFEGFLERGRQAEALLPQLGQRLYEAVLPSIEARKAFQEWRARCREQCQISIISNVPEVLSLPWELLHDGQHFLALDSDHPVAIVRRLSQDESTPSAASFHLPLRVLLVTARPTDEGFIDPRNIARELLNEMQNQIDTGYVELEILRPPTLTGLRERLKNLKRPVHVVHFDGHGIFDEGKGKQGYLAFEDDRGRCDQVAGRDVAKALRGSSVQLVVLNACQSAVSAGDNAFSSVAAQLLRGGIDAVVAMSASFLVVSAAHYVEAFYRALAAGMPVQIAQARARRALSSDVRRQPFSRSLDEEGVPVEMQDWWVPHFYQQRLVTLRSTNLPSTPKQPQTFSRLSQSMPAPPRDSFVGRAYDLHLIERLLRRRWMVVIHGFGGIGKTTLVREAADWLTRTGMYDGASYVSFEQGADAAMFLKTLGSYLGADHDRVSSDVNEGLARLTSTLKQKRILIVADHIESLLPGGETPLSVASRNQLWGVLLALRDLGAGVLLVSRDTALDDKRLTVSNRVIYYELKELSPQDSYALATLLLDKLEINRAQTPYLEVHDLLSQLDHHPLAILLVFRALLTYSLAKIRTDFVALFPEFVDTTEENVRNRSLLVSLGYSLRRLSEEHRTLLSHLAPFEGGVREYGLLRVTQFATSTWAGLRSALEQNSLLRIEQTHQNLTDLFLHFHPMLVPFLRYQYGEPEQLRERYTGYFQRFIEESYFDKDHYPEPLFAMVRREVPNTLRALKLLLDTGKLDTVSTMADQIAGFLHHFGLVREHSQLRRWVAEAASDKNAQREEILEMLRRAAAEAAAEVGVKIRMVEEPKLTHAEWMRESGLGEDEYNKGNIRDAAKRFKALLARIEAQPVDTPLRHGSYEHSVTLILLARCFLKDNQPSVAEHMLREALAIHDSVMREYPENRELIYQRGRLLIDLGEALGDQGQSQQEERLYLKALEIARQGGNQDFQALVLSKIASLAMDRHAYELAQRYYTQALELESGLGKLKDEAATLHSLGYIAHIRKQWHEAERYYRESLTIEEKLHNEEGIASSCTQLGLLAMDTDRFSEAEYWYKRTLEIDERLYPGTPKHAGALDNLAVFLLMAVGANHAPRTRLSEARAYAERALALRETFGDSGEVWHTLINLAAVAKMEERVEDARDYRRRAYENFAASRDHRNHIDEVMGSVIANIASAAQGELQAREKVNTLLPQLESQDWHITGVVQRIWAGERDWHLLAEDLDLEDALLVLRVLETLREYDGSPSFASEDDIMELITASLPASIHEALKQHDPFTFFQDVEKALQVLRAMETLREYDGSPSFASEDDTMELITASLPASIHEALEQLGPFTFDEVGVLLSEEQSLMLEIIHFIQVYRFEALLQAVAGVVIGNNEQQREIETVLADLETRGFHLEESVQRIWDGERDIKALTEGLNALEGALVRRILEIIRDVHAEVYLGNAGKQIVAEPIEAARILCNMGVHYLKQGRHTEAEPLLRRALTITEKQRGFMHPDTITDLKNLAALYQELGQYNEAEPLRRRILTIDEQTLGTDHPQIATDLNNLADLYLEQRQFDKAEPLYQRAIAIYQQQSGLPQHDMAISISYLATCYVQQGKYSLAEALLEQPLPTLEQELTSEEPISVTNRKNLAMLYQEQNRYAEAEPLWVSALMIDEQTLGKNHPNVATESTNLATCYIKQGKRDQAEPLLQRALAIYEQQLGPTHPHTITGTSNLIGLYLEQGVPDKAEALLQHTLAMNEQALGTNHPDLVTTLEHLSSPYWKLEQYDKVEPLQRRALAIREQHSGPSHPSTVEPLERLALLYWLQDEYDKAEPLYLRALTIKEQTLGADHPDLVLDLDILALLYHKQELYDKAEPVYHRALAIKEQQLGSPDPKTIETLDLLALLYERQEKYDQAELLHQRILMLKEQVFGANHPELIASLNNLAELAKKQGKHELAEQFYQRVLAIHTIHSGNES